MLYNYQERLKLYMALNPSLGPKELAQLVTIDSLYRSVPHDIALFRHLYAHMDPANIDGDAVGIQFLNIANSQEPESVIRHRLNHYINMKYNYLGHPKSYDENMRRFRMHSQMVSDILGEILDAAGFSEEIKSVLNEHEKVRACTDFYEILALFRSTNDRKIRYEILRKIGIIVLLSRISRSWIIDELNTSLASVQHVFFEGLGLARQSPKYYYYWADEQGKVQFSSNRKEAEVMYKADADKRKTLGRQVYPLQVFEYAPFRTRFNSRILHIEFRNKLSRGGELNFTSFVEKIIRKNLEFPNQVHDLLGVRIIVENEEQIPQLVTDLQTFLGGSSTRKKEKNALYKFGKKKVSKFSSDDYYVWKAVYDMTLPHPSIKQVNKMLELTKGNPSAQKELRQRLMFFMERPQDFVVEVQLQDIRSFLMSSAKGSTADHAVLKQNQILINSLYKIFPKEVYEPELLRLKAKILATHSSG